MKRKKEINKCKAMEEILLNVSLLTEFFEKLPVFCDTRRFVTVFTTAYHLAFPFYNLPSCFFNTLK